MNNYQKYVEGVRLSRESEGSSAKKMEAYYESIEYQLAQLNAAWESFTQKVLDSEVYKTIIKFVTFLVDNLPKVLTTTFQIMAILKSYKAPAFISHLIKNGIGFVGKNGKQGFLGKIMGTIAPTQEKALAEEEALDQGRAGLINQMKNIFNMGTNLRTAIENNTSAINNNSSSQQNNTTATNAEKNTVQANTEATKTETTVEKTGIKVESAQNNVVEKNTAAVQNNTAAQTGQKGGDKSLVKNAVFYTGVMAAFNGITGFINGYTTGNSNWTDKLLKTKGGSSVGDLEASTKDRLITGAHVGMGAAGGTIAGAAIGGAIAGGSSGSVAGPMGAAIGAAVGITAGFVTAAIHKYIEHQIELERKDRVDAALKIIESIDSLKETVHSLDEKVHTVESWDESDISEVRNYVRDIKKQMATDTSFTLLSSFYKTAKEQMGTLGKNNVTANDYLELLVNGTNEQVKTVNNILQAVILRNKASETYKAQESDRLSYSNIISSIEDSVVLNNESILKNIDYLKSSWNDQYVNKIVKTSTSEMLNSTIPQYYADIISRYINPDSIIQNKGNYYGYSFNGGTKEMVAELDAAYEEVAEGMTSRENELDAQGETMSRNERSVWEATLENLEYSRNLAESAVEGFKELNREVNQIAIQAAVYSSDVGSWNSVEIANKTLEEAIIKVVDEAEKNGDLVGIMARDSMNYITDEAREYATSILRNMSGFEALFNKTSHNLRTLLNIDAEKHNLSAIIGKSYEEILDVVDTMDTKVLMEFANKMNEAQKTQAWNIDTMMSYILLLNDATNETRSFAKALGVDINSLSRYENLARVSLSDLSKSVEEVTSEMDSLTSVISDVTSAGGLSVKNLSQILKTNPELVGTYKNGNFIGFDTSTANIYSNIIGDMFGAHRYGTLLANSLYNEIADNNKIFNLFKESAKAAGKEVDYLNASFTSLTESAIDEIRKHGDIDFLNTFLSGILPEEYLEYYQGILEELSSYQEKLIDNQISNLQEQKEALSKVNDEYQKQIDLIKAMQALENAKNEKKRVYRAGVGWTYEADQEAIKEAQDNLKKIRDEQEQENLQYQIDLLEQMKQIIEDIPENQKLEEQGKLFEIFGNQMRGGISGVGDFLSALNDAYINLSVLNNELFPQLIKDKTAVNVSVLDALTNDLADYLDISKFLNEEEGSSTILDEAETMAGSHAFQEAAKKYNEQLDAAKDFYEKMDVAHWGMYFGENNKLTEGGLDKLNAGYGLNKSQTQLTTQQAEQIYQDFLSYNKKSGYSVSDVDTRKAYSDLGGDVFYTSDDGEMIYTPGAKRTSNNHVDENPNDNYEITFNNGTKYWLRNVDDESGSLEQNQYLTKLFDNFIMTHQGRNPVEGDIIKYKNDFYVKTKNSQIWYKMKMGNEHMNDGDKFRKDFDNAYEHSYASGTLSTPLSSPSLINERGLEGIVTPQGTLTSLPAKTGIVPADLTRNLYQLGEVAPNLIRKLSQEQSLTTKTVDSMEDNSMHVNTLNANFETGDNFDFQKLLTQARQYVATTRNNRR